MKVIIRHFDRVKRRLSARNTIHRLTLPQIKRALTDVWREMKLLGLASEQVDEVPVYLVSPLGTFSRRMHFRKWRFIRDLARRLCRRRKAF